MNTQATLERPDAPAGAAPLIKWNGPYWGLAPDGSLPANFFLSAFFEYVQDTSVESESQLIFIQELWDDAYRQAFAAALRAVEKKNPDAGNFEPLLAADGWPLFMSQIGRKRERSDRGNLDAQRVKEFVLYSLEREYHSRELVRLAFWLQIVNEGAPAAEIQARRAEFAKVFAEFLQSEESDPGSGHFKQSGLTIDDLIQALLSHPQDVPTEPQE